MRIAKPRERSSAAPTWRSVENFCVAKRAPGDFVIRTPLIPRAIPAFAREYSCANAGIPREELRRRVGLRGAAQQPERTRVREMEPVRVRGLPQPGRTLVMGVVNVTPDSFSDGGEWFAADQAIQHGRQLWDEGADLVDVGGESTRPGAERPEPAEELRRVLPVVEALAAQGAAVSIDTMRAQTARAAVQAGAILVNDVSGGLADENMVTTVAELGVPYVCMHWRGHSADMQSRADYDDVVAEVVAELAGQIERCLDGGIARDQLIIDPGIGFAKNAEHNWELLSRLDELDVLGKPLLLGVSRKTFLGRLLGTDDRPAAGQGAGRRLGGPNGSPGRPIRLGGAHPHRTSPSGRDCGAQQLQR